MDTKHKHIISFRKTKNNEIPVNDTQHKCEKNDKYCSTKASYNGCYKSWVFNRLRVYKNMYCQTLFVIEYNAFTSLIKFECIKILLGTFPVSNLNCMILPDLFILFEIAFVQQYFIYHSAVYEFALISFIFYI